MSVAGGRARTRSGPCWLLAGILPLCAGGSRALAAVQRAATLRGSTLRRLLSPHHLAAPDLTPWPRRATSLCHRRDDIAEFLRAFSGIHFGRVNIALGVDGEIMHPVELASVTAVAAEHPDDLAGVAHQRAHLVVGAVGVEQEALLSIDPEVEVPYRARGSGAFFVRELLHEGAVLAEDLDAVVGAIAHIDQAVLRDLHAMNGIAELR